MSSVCFYFQVHQPFRVARYSFFDSAEWRDYFDNEKNQQIMRKVAEKCYLPTNRKMLELIERHQGNFRISFSISGVALEQMQLYAPDVLESFQLLVETGCVELISETYFHSLGVLYDKGEFQYQVQQHRDLVEELFDYTPSCFRNTELIYNSDIGRTIAEMGYKAVLTEGPDDIMAWRSPNFVYTVPGTSLRQLTKNYRLSDDIAFRFSDRNWKEHPLLAEKFASWVHRISGNGDVLNLFMDYETFGEHQWADSGIFEFLDSMPGFVMNHSDWDFATPSEVVERYPSIGELDFARLTSWADEARDITAWRGNSMQEKALSSIYRLHSKIHALGDTDLTHTWRKLQTSDHFYYMCTKWFADGDVHAYFSPYESPYDAFVNYMNVLRDFESVVNRRLEDKEDSAAKAA